MNLNEHKPAIIKAAKRALAAKNRAEMEFLCVMMEKLDMEDNSEEYQVWHQMETYLWDYGSSLADNPEPHMILLALIQASMTTRWI